MSRQPSFLGLFDQSTELKKFGMAANKQLIVTFAFLIIYVRMPPQAGACMSRTYNNNQALSSKSMRKHHLFVYTFCRMPLRGGSNDVAQWLVGDNMTIAGPVEDCCCAACILLQCGEISRAFSPP
jgi:hypothetical protein